MPGCGLLFMPVYANKIFPFFDRLKRPGQKQSRPLFADHKAGRRFLDFPFSLARRACFWPQWP